MLRVYCVLKVYRVSGLQKRWSAVFVKCSVLGLRGTGPLYALLRVWTVLKESCVLRKQKQERGENEQKISKIL